MISSGRWDPVFGGVVAVLMYRWGLENLLEPELWELIQPALRLVLAEVLLATIGIILLLRNVRWLYAGPLGCLVAFAVMLSILPFTLMLVFLGRAPFEVFATIAFVMAPPVMFAALVGIVAVRALGGVLWLASGWGKKPQKHT